MAKKSETKDPTGPKELKATELLGESYMVRPIKGYVGILIAGKLSKMGDKDTSPVEMLETVDMLIDAVFAKPDAKKIRKRLADPDDAADLGDVIEKFGELVGEATGNPTT